MRLHTNATASTLTVSVYPREDCSARQEEVSIFQTTLCYTWGLSARGERWGLRNKESDVPLRGNSVAPQWGLNGMALHALAGLGCYL